MTTDRDAMQLISPNDTDGQLVGQSRVDVSHSSTDYLSSLKFFEHDPPLNLLNHTHSTPVFRGAVVPFPHYQHPALPVANEIVNTPFYTSAPLRITAQVQGEADRATPYFVRSALTEFINPDVASSGDPNAINLRKFRVSAPAIGAVRGRHFIWVRDLDACFYAVPAMWGLHDPNNATNSYGPSELSVAQKILEYLRETPKSQMMVAPPTDSATDIWSRQDMLNLASLAPKNYGHISDISEALQNLNATTDDKYPYWRSDLEAYFTTNIDVVHNPDGTTNNLSTFKPAPAAININTAPEEVLQAMFSQIPYTDAVDAMGIPTDTFALHVSRCHAAKTYYAELFAKRIVAKRPFLSRMDFEDFLASLLVGTSTDQNTYLGAINYAIGKRISGEIRLAQFMEMPGLPEGDYTDSTGATVLAVNPYKGANTTLNMQARFNFFLNDISSVGQTITVGTRDQCALTVKALNNVLNSVSTSPGPSFHCTVVLPIDLPGATSHGANAVAIQFDPTDTYSPSFVRLGGDDVYDAANHRINAGPNGIVETGVFGYSYYSHDYAEQYYKPIRYMAADPIHYTVATCSNPALVGKFVYGVTPNLDPTNLALYKNYGLVDLAKWSCVGEGTISGYYDLYFNLFDQMVMELGEKAPSGPGAANRPGVTFVPPATAPVGITPVFQTGVNSAGTSDVQVVALGDAVADPNQAILVIPGPSGTLTTQPGGVPFSTASTGTPDDRIVEAIRLARLPGNRTSAINGSDSSYVAADGYMYIYANKANSFALLSALGAPSGDPGDTDTKVSVIVDGGDGMCGTSTTSDDQRLTTPPGTVIDHTTVGPNLYNESSVWGPIRASQRLIDQPYSPDQTPTASAATLALPNKGDVAWSPPICFRSRYFGTYVLAQGMITQPLVGSVSPGAAVNTVNFNPIETDAGKLAGIKAAIVPGAFFAISSAPIAGVPAVQHVYTIESVNGSTLTLSTPLVATPGTSDYAAVYTSKTIGDRRNESIYDAYNDEVLWTRSPLTDKRTLGDFAP